MRFNCMPLIEYDILKDALISLNIEDKFVDKMIINSHSFVDTLKNHSISYTFPLYTSLKKIDDIFNTGGIPENLIEKLKPISVHIKFLNNFKFEKVECFYGHGEELHVIDLNFSMKSCYSTQIPRISEKHISRAILSLEKLSSNFGLDKNICEFIKKNKFMNRVYGYLNVSDYGNKFTIKSDHPSKACVIPNDVLKIFGKDPFSLSFEFDSKYVCEKVLFIDREIKISSNSFNMIYTYIKTDINGKLISYAHEVKDNKQRDPITGDLVTLSYFEIKIGDLPIDEIEMFVKIYSSKTNFIDIVPEFFVTGPTNIPNFSERFNLAQMMAC